MQLYQSVGIEERPEDFRPTTFVGLALRPGEIDPGMMGHADSTHEIQSSRTVLTLDSEGKEKDEKHAMSLYLPKIEYSRTLESLPFSHPKQLVEILPTLRQYAFTTSLLRDSFFEKPQKPNTSNLMSPPMAPPVAKDEDALQIDVNLTYTPPAPRLTCYIPRPLSTPNHPDPASVLSVSDLLSNLLSDNNNDASHAPLNVTFDIHANGELVIREQNVVHVGSEVDMDKAEQGEQRVKRLGKALDVCGGLGVWGEWLRREVQKN
jgi:hypothetical protein